LVIAPTSSGKTFIGEMAAIGQVIHLQKIIYLVPLRALNGFIFNINNVEIRILFQ
jgi:replicative superfamily II helicase